MRTKQQLRPHLGAATPSIRNVGRREFCRRQAGQSRADFISKYAIALKEARETCYWLRLLIESGDCQRESGSALVQEADELKRIIAAIIIKAKQNAPHK